MGSLKIGNRQPSVGTLKQGNTNISKIYKGDDLVWPLGGEPDNYEPLSDDNVRFVGLYDKKLITYFTNVDTPFPFDSQYIDQEISYTGMEFRIFDQITAISDNMEYIYAMSRTSSSVTYLTYKGTDSGSGLSFTLISDVDVVQSISKDGRYVYGLSLDSGVTDRTILKISSDYGQTFGNEINFNDTNNPNNIVDSVACSMGGKYVYAVSQLGQDTLVYKSSDYGSSFSNISSITGLARGTSSSLSFFPIVSGNGQYVYFYALHTTSTNLPSGNIITMSDNFGASFFEISVGLRGGGFVNNQTDKFGKYLFLSNQGSDQEGLVSTNYAQTTQGLNLSGFSLGTRQTSLSNFGTVGLMETSTRITTSTPMQEVATSVDSLQNFNELGQYVFSASNYGPIQKVVNIE
jgi:hypothetical protein